jgi:succinate-acetate transporter protein
MMMNGMVSQEGIQPDAADLEQQVILADNNMLLASNESPIRTRVSGTIEYVPMSLKSLDSANLRATSIGSCTSHNSSYAASNNNNNNSNSSSKSNDTANGTPSNEKVRHQRLVAVRYFLDRPGYGLHDSAMRLWFDPPALCTPAALRQFLEEQGIALSDLLTEVYLDKFQSFMLLEACEAAAIEWDLKDTTTQNPGTLNIRLTDVSYAQRLDDDMSKSLSGPGAAPHAPQTQQQAPQHQHANTTPVGLFAFSMMVGLETAAAMAALAPGSIDESFVIAWGPYMFFAGGVLQIITGLLQVFRNNIYGAVAFLGFGSFWFANGTKVILENHFSAPGTEAADLLTEADPWGTFIRASYILAFTLALLKQTFVMSKLSTTLISLLCCKIFCQALAGWSDTLLWMQVIFGWITSWFAFYVFLVEFTNQVYHREVFKTYKWSEKHSPEEAFGVAGKSATLYSKASRLRQAHFPNISGVRSAMAGKRTSGKKTE